MGFPRLLEYILGRVLSASKGYDNGLLVNQLRLKDIPEAIEVTCELGPSGSPFHIEHTGLGPEHSRNIFPTNDWRPNESIKDEVKQYCIVVQDPDSPIPPSIYAAVHGVFYAIPSTKTRISQEDLAIDKGRSAEADEGVRWTRGGFRLGKVLGGVPYGGPRPPCGHGEHRYYFQVLALKSSIESSSMSPSPNKKELEKELEGNVLGYGSWIGVFEYKRR